MLRNKAEKKMFRNLTEPFVKKINSSYNHLYSLYHPLSISTSSPDMFRNYVTKSNPKSFLFKPKKPVKAAISMNALLAKGMDFLVLAPKNNKFIQKPEGFGELYDYSVLATPKWTDLCIKAQEQNYTILVVRATDSISSVSKEAIVGDDNCFKYFANLKNTQVTGHIASTELSPGVWWDTHYTLLDPKAVAQKISTMKASTLPQAVNQATLDNTP